MALEWAGSGPELLLTSTAPAPPALRAQLEGQLRDAIRSRPAGRRRAAAVLARTRPRTSACPAASSRTLRPAPGRGLPHLARRVGHPGRRRRPSRRGPNRRAGPRPRGPAAARRLADFRVRRARSRARAARGLGVGDPRGLPHRPNAAFDYGDPRGEPRLRDVLAAYLRRVRAVAADADQLVVCAGFAQGLALVLRSPGRRGLPTRRVRGPRRGRHVGRGAHSRGATRCRYRSTSTASTSPRWSAAAPARAGDPGTPVADRRRARRRSPAGADRLGPASATR